MPIEIRELVIRARVDPSGGRQATRSARGAADTGAADSGGQPPERAIIETCVREVLRILEEKRER